PEENMVRQKCSGIRRSYLDEAAFIALKNTGNHGQIEITRMNKPVSHPFKTAGLRDALSDLNWEDCISH
ncbi:hypothetical protein SG71_21690, partial [Enterobacter chengduensis]